MRHGSILLGLQNGNYNFQATDDGELGIGYFDKGYNFQVTKSGIVNIAKNLNIGRYTTEGEDQYYFKVDNEGKVTVDGTIYA
jgi:hypothetical protein